MHDYVGVDVCGSIFDRRAHFHNQGKCFQGFKIDKNKKFHEKNCNNAKMNSSKYFLKFLTK